MSSAAGSSPGYQGANPQAIPQKECSPEGWMAQALSQPCPEPTRMSPHRAAALKRCLKQQGEKSNLLFTLKGKENWSVTVYCLSFTRAE